MSILFQLDHLPAPVIRHLNGLWKRRWLIAAAAWLAALAGWFLIWLIPDEYESRAQVFVQTETILQPVLNGVTARPDFSSRVEVMRLQLLARPNVEEIIYRSGLDKRIEASSEVERQAKMQGMVNWVASNIDIRSPRDMYFVITYDHSNPETAKRVTDAVLNLLIEQDIGANLSENATAKRQLDLQIEEFEERLQANEIAVATFRREHATELGASKGTSRRRDSAATELTRTSEQIARTRGRIVTLQNLLSATPRGSSGGELDRLRVELAELRSKYEESHPDIRGVLARIEQLESEDGTLSLNPEYIRLQSELRVARNSINTLEARQAALQEELDALDIAVGQSPAIIAELQQIERQYETTKDTYEELLARRDRLQLTESLGPGGRGVEYQVFERPERAIKPSSPNREILILGVVVAALGAGLCGGLILNLLDKSYTQSDELKTAFGLPVLGAFTERASKEVRSKRLRDIVGLTGAGVALVAMSFLYVYLSVERLPSHLTEEATNQFPVTEGAPWG